MVLHRHALSGHSHRVELFLALLGLPCELVDVDLKAGAHKRPEFLRLNPFGQVPVLQDGPVTLSDSNAILVYLARRYGGERWLPQDPVAAAEVQRWLSVAAGPLHKGPASARLVTVFGAKLDHDQAKTVAEGLFQVLDAHLATGAFVAGSEPTIADIALYSYTAHAPEGGVSLEPFGAIRRWLQSIEALPGFVPMAATKVGLLAD
ncbi:MAG: glutathione S-transferase family protein [Candidatus Competibacterales bacterium]